MEGHEDAVLAGLLPDGGQSALARGDALARLVLVGVEALLLQPAGSLDGGLAALVFEPLPVAAGAEGGGGDGLEVDHIGSFPVGGSRQREFVSSIILTDWAGFCNRVGKDFQIWVCRSVCAWRFPAFRAGFQGGRSPPWVKKGVAGSAEGGPERLGAHR